MSGWLAEGLTAMCTDHDYYYAQLLNEAVAGAGTKDDLLIRWVRVPGRAPLVCSAAA